MVFPYVLLVFARLKNTRHVAPYGENGVMYGEPKALTMYKGRESGILGAKGR